MLEIMPFISLPEIRNAICFEIVIPWDDAPTEAFLWVSNSSVEKVRDVILESSRIRLYSEFSDGTQLDYYTESIAARVVGWKNITVAGEELKYSSDAAVLFIKENAWVIPQILEKIFEIDEHLKEVQEEAIEFATYQFKMGSRQEDGSSLKDHLDSAKVNPFAPALMPKEEIVVVDNPPKLPESCTYVWSYFLRLHSGRGQGGFGGFLPISYLEIQAMCQIEKVSFDMWEIDLIKAFDRGFLTESNKQQAKEQKK